MRIVHLIDHLGLGGAQSLLLDLIEARDRSDDHRVWTLTGRVLPATEGRLADAGVPLRRLSGGRANPWGLVRLRSWVARERPDVVHAYLDYSNTLGVAAVLAAGRPLPAVVSQIDNDPAQHYPALPRMLLGRLAPRVDAHLFISNSLRESSQSVLRHRCRRAELLNPTVDLRRFDRSRVAAADAAKVRDGADVVVGTVGRLAVQKAHEVLLEATPALLAGIPGLRVVVVGDGPRRDELAARARALGVERAVRFAGYRTDVEVALAAMDVFVLPSRHEGFGLAAAEAMAMEVPVVASRVVGTVDAVGEDRGVLVPAGNPAALSTAVLRVLGDEGLRRRIVRNGRDWVRRHCDRGAAAGAVRSLYAELAGARTARPASGESA